MARGASQSRGGMDGRPHYALDVREIEQMLRERAEELFWELMPNARRDGHFLTVGSMAGEPGQSLKFNINGPNRGMWTDFAQWGYLGGDCLSLIREVLFAGNMGEAIKYAKSWLGLDHLDPSRLETKRRDAQAAMQASAEQDAALAEQKRSNAKAMWLSGKVIEGTPAAAYLSGRGIDVERLGKWPGSLRFHAEIWNREEKLKIPAMLAAMYSPDGAFRAVHRTYLRHDKAKGWVKLDSPNAKMVLGKCAGSFIPLRKGASDKSMADLPEGEGVLITEGIEDALTVAMACPDMRIVAGYSLGNIGSIVWPERMGPLTLIADRDEAGSSAVDALERVIARQQARGVAVRIAMPPRGVKDFNDWLRQGPEQGAAA